MKTNLIPKSLTAQKLIIFRNFNFFDLALTIIYALFSIGISSSLIFVNVGYRTIIGMVLFLLLAITLCSNSHFHLKNYQIISKFLIHCFQNKQFQVENKKYNTAVLVPYKRLVEDMIETETLEGGRKWLIGALEIKGFNISTLGYEEQLLKISLLQDLFKTLDCQVSLLKINQPLVLEQQTNWLIDRQAYLQKMYEKHKLSAAGLKSRMQQLNGYLNDYHSKQGLIGPTTTSKRFYLFIYHQQTQQVHNYRNLAAIKLQDVGLETSILNRYQLVNVIKSLFNPFEQPFSPELINKYQNHLDELLKFKEIEFSSDHFRISNVYYSLNSIHDYPVFIRNGWGAILANTPTTMVWNIKQMNNSEVKDLIHRAIGNAETNLLSTKKVVDKSQQHYQIEVFNLLVNQLSSGEESVKKCHILMLNYGTDYKNLKQNQAHLKQLLRDENIVIDDLKLQQKQAYSAFILKPTDPLMQKKGREMPTRTLAGSFPFINNALTDENGQMLGFNFTGDLVLFDQFQTDYHRKNFNQLLLGTSGSGKSFTAKKQLNWHISNGRKVIVIDPEREYRALCQYHDGNWIDVGNASYGQINPLQILNSLDDNESNQIVIANYLQTLEHWFSIILPDLNASELRYLIKKVGDLYEAFDLINQRKLTKLRAVDFPIFDDLLMLLKAEIEPSSVHQKITEIISLEFTNHGKYAQLYNNYSTLGLNQNLLTVFDINSLFEKGNNRIIQAQLFLILAYIQHEVKINSFFDDNEIIILVDEAHLIIDKDNPIGLNFMFQMVKRIRKRRGGMILITQNPDDFVGSPEIRKKTMAMMNNTQYTMVLNLSPQNLSDIKTLFKAYGGLSNQECDFIAKAKRGQGLFIVSGFNRHCLQVHISRCELAAFNNEPLGILSLPIPQNLSLVDLNPNTNQSYKLNQTKNLVILKE